MNSSDTFNSITANLALVDRSTVTGKWELGKRSKTSETGTIVDSMKDNIVGRLLINCSLQELEIIEAAVKASRSDYVDY